MTGQDPKVVAQRALFWDSTITGMLNRGDCMVLSFGN